MSHSHHDHFCGHLRLKFCAVCRKPYCEDCHKEWEESCTRSHNYAYWYTTYPQYGTAVEPDLVTPTITCAHTS